MPEPNPETPRFSELSPDQLAEVEAVVEMSRQIMAEPDLLVEDEDQPEFQIGPSPVTPYHTEVDADRMYWNETEWAQIVRMMAEQFRVPETVILEAEPGPAHETIATCSDELGTFWLGISRTMDEVEPGQVPYVLVVTTEELGWGTRD